MSGLFGVMGTATRALFVTQSGLRTTAHNIANAQTPGFSRQRVEQSTAPPELRATGHIGRGVEQDTVIRITDDLLAEQLRREDGLLGSTTTQADILSQVESLLNEQGDRRGLSTMLSEVYDAFADLASATEPGASVERQSLRAVAESALNTIHRLDADLRELQRGLNTEIVSTVETVNDLALRIAALNRQIVGQEISAPANDLRDSRDLLVRELAEIVDVSTFEEDNGAMTVMTGGGLPLVQGNRTSRLIANADPTNPFAPDFVSVVYDLNGVNIDVSSSLRGGRLAGLFAGRDGSVAGAIRSLDTVAYNLVTQVNTVHAAGVGLDGTVGNFFLALGAVEDAARDIALDPNIVADIQSIAAGLTTAPGDNRNALALAALRDTPAPLFLPGDPPGPASGSTQRLLDYSAQFVSGVGLEARALADARDQQADVLDVLQTRRDEISGVSLDEEMAQLVELEKIYQANARILNTVNGLLDDVLSLLS